VGDASALARPIQSNFVFGSMQVIAQCPFVKAYIGKHPDYPDLLNA
jgi:hypothetical protein